MGFFTTSIDLNSAPSPSFIPFNHSSFIYQNSLYLSLSKVLGVQRLIVYPQYLAVISTITERSQEECGNLEKDHLELTGTFQEDFPEEGVLELSLTRCRMPFRQR